MEIKLIGSKEIEYIECEDVKEDELDEVIKAWKYDYLYGQINSENIEGITCSRMFSVN